MLSPWCAIGCAVAALLTLAAAFAPSRVRRARREFQASALSWAIAAALFAVVATQVPPHSVRVILFAVALGFSWVAFMVTCAATFARGDAATPERERR